MPTVQQWGRRESFMWPPRGYLYTLGALFLACVATGFFIWVHLQYGLSPLERYYLAYHVRSEIGSLPHASGTYRMVRVTDGRSPGRLVLNEDVQLGSTLQSDGTELPLKLTPKTAQVSQYLLYREPPRTYPNQAIHAWISHWIYGDVQIYGLFRMQLWFGLAVLVLQLPYSIPKDIARIRQLRYGRRLKGPVLVSTDAFNKAVAGDGIGITTNDTKRPLRIPRYRDFNANLPQSRCATQSPPREKP
jgi:hypothetical protein